MRLTLAVLLVAQPAFGISLWSSADGSRYWALDTALKWTALSRRAPPTRRCCTPSAGARPHSGGGGWRCEAKLRRICTCAWPMSNGCGRFLLGAGAGGGVGILVPEVRAPYRLRQLDDALAMGDNATYRHELDRAFVAWHSGAWRATNWPPSYWVGARRALWRGGYFRAV